MSIKTCRFPARKPIRGLAGKRKRTFKAGSSSKKALQSASCRVQLPDADRSLNSDSDHVVCAGMFFGKCSVMCSLEVVV